MTIDKSGVDYVSAPRDYAELFRIYYPYVVSLVRKWGISEDRKEDVASEILIRFMEKGCLETFDPTMVFVYDGKERPARFRSFLSRFVIAYTRGYLERQQQLARRELQLCNVPVGEPDASGPTQWVDVYGEPIPDIADAILDMIEATETVEHWKKELAKVPRRSPADNCDLPALLDAVVEQVLEYGIWDVPKLCERFGKKTTAMHAWLWWMRANLAPIAGRKCPDRRPRTVKK